jgi:hypothetical protein
MSQVLTPIRWLARSPRWAFLVLFILGFSLRAGTLTLIPTDLIPPNPDWETGAVALSLLERGEFADPYLIPTGPTAHTPPLLVGLFALLYKCLGYSFLGGLIRWLLVMAAHSATFALLPWFSGRMGLAREVGVVGGLLGAGIPHWPYELESFSALALILLVVAFLGRSQGTREKESGKGRKGPADGRSGLASLGLGLAAGVSFHLQPVLLPVVAGFLAFEGWSGQTRRTNGGISLFLLGIALACLPWGFRNYRVLGEPYFIRSNLGLELHVGNHEGAHADIDVSDARKSFQHPRTDLEEAEQVRELGEAEYMRRKMREALSWIGSNPRKFLALTVTRSGYFWGGPLHRFPTSSGHLLLTLIALLGAWRLFPSLAPPERAALWIPLLTYPLIYYVVAYMPRYGYPVRWILFFLAGAAIWGGVGGGISRNPPEPTCTAET